ncbi:MAG: hypothetical protein ACK5LP_08065 [Campylobacteraceae bacterium]
MTRDEATFEMRYYNVSEDDIEAILNSCKQKNILPQFLDIELEKLGYDKFFYAEYEDGIDDGYAQSEKSSKKHIVAD